MQKIFLEKHHSVAFNGISRTQSDDTKFCPTPYLCLRDVDDETVGLTGCLDHKTGKIKIEKYQIFKY